MTAGAEISTELRLPAELLVLSYYAGDGKPAGDKINAGVAGAELVELMLTGRIRLRKFRKFGQRTTWVEVTDFGPTGNPALNGLLLQIALAKRPKQAKDWMAKRTLALKAYRRQLSKSGVLVLDEVDARWLPRKVKRYRPQSVDRAAAMKAQVRSTLLEGTPMHPRAVALAALAHASGMTNQLMDKPERNIARAAAQRLPETFQELVEAGELPSDNVELSDSLDEFCSGLGEFVASTSDAGDSGGGDGND